MMFVRCAVKMLDSFRSICYNFFLKHRLNFLKKNTLISIKLRIFASGFKSFWL